MIDATGDVVTGDIIQFTEGVFAGSFRRPKYIGERTIKAFVLNESYGSAKGQHTFTLRVISSDGLEPVQVGSFVRRKGRNIYRNGTLREWWVNEDERDLGASEKHKRGNVSRGGRR